MENYKSSIEQLTYDLKMLRQNPKLRACTPKERAIWIACILFSNTKLKNRAPLGNKWFLDSPKPS